MKTTDQIAAEAAEKQQRGFQLAYGITPHLPDLIADFKAATEEATKEWRKKAYALGHDLIRAAHESEESTEYWHKLYNDASRDFGLLRKEFDAYRAAHASEQGAEREVLQVILDCVDYKAGNCTQTQMVGSVLPTEVIDKARAVLSQSRAAHESEPWSEFKKLLDAAVIAGELRQGDADYVIGLLEPPAHKSERVFDQIEGAKQCIKKGFYAQAELVLNDVLSLRAAQASK